MKNYIKPEMEIKLFDTNSSIANSISGGVGNPLNDYDNKVGTAGWGQLFGNNQ